MSLKFDFPLDVKYILRKKNALIREFQEKDNLKEIRVAVLGGSSTQDVVKLMNLFLLSKGYKATFFESDYNRYYETVMYSNDLSTFNPDVIYVHTSLKNLLWTPSVRSTKDDVEKALSNELVRLDQLASKMRQQTNASVIVNNVEYPKTRTLGNYDAVFGAGVVRYIRQLNEKIAEYIESQKNINLLDINYLASLVGIDAWYDEKMWYSFGYGMSLEAIVHIAHNVSNIIAAIKGDAKKCVTVDLDNTLWNGIVGDDGADGISVGDGTPLGKAHADLQKYLKDLFDRGITLTVCSKNEMEMALAGLESSGMVLSKENFSIIKANWMPKDQNILETASELNIGMNSVVFLDDNPAEREIVRRNLPSVSVPDIGEDPSEYTLYLDRNGYFEAISLSTDDMNRNEYYKGNQAREEHMGTFSDYKEYLISLDMKVEIGDFTEPHMDRIHQLTNKTNQFNLTTKRMTKSEIDEYKSMDSKLGLYAKLTDKFGDNGLVSVLAGTIDENCFVIDLWLMSCRVFKRDLEYALFYELVKKLKGMGVSSIRGLYLPTDRNKSVSTLYRDLGFELENELESMTIWIADIESLELDSIDHIERIGGE